MQLSKSQTYGLNLIRYIIWKVQELQQIALNVRSNCIQMAKGGGCFLGASLSCADILVYLYAEHLFIPNLTSEERDIFLLSKGMMFLHSTQL